MRLLITKQLEIVFRHVVVYPLLRLVFRNEINETAIDIRSVKKILIFRADGIGDMIVSTPMFRRLKEANPHLHLAVFASHRNIDIIRFNQHIDRIFLLHRTPWRFFQEILRARSERYDVVVNFVFNRTTLEGIMANLIAPRGAKIGQGPDKYRFYFNRMLPINHGGPHMVEILSGMVKDAFGLNTDPVGLTYEVTVNREAKDRVDRFLAIKGLQRRESPSRNTIYMVLNFAAVDEVRRMSVDQTVELIRLLSRIRPERPVIIFPPGDRSTLDEILRRSDAALPVVYPDDGTATLLEIASLIAGAQYVITPDTSIIHFASAFKIPLFALYTPTAARNHQWLPYGVFYRSVRAQLGSGVSSIPFNQILTELNAFWKELDSGKSPTLAPESRSVHHG